MPEDMARPSLLRVHIQKLLDKFANCVDSSASDLGLHCLLRHICRTQTDLDLHCLQRQCFSGFSKT